MTSLQIYEFHAVRYYMLIISYDANIESGPIPECLYKSSIFANLHHHRHLPTYSVQDFQSYWPFCGLVS